MIAQRQRDTRTTTSASCVEIVDHLVPLTVLRVITDEESVTEFGIGTSILPSFCVKVPTADEEYLSSVAFTARCKLHSELFYTVGIGPGERGEEANFGVVCVVETGAISSLG